MNELDLEEGLQKVQLEESDRIRKGREGEMRVCVCVE